MILFEDEDFVVTKRWLFGWRVFDRVLGVSAKPSAKLKNRLMEIQGHILSVKPIQQVNQPEHLLRYAWRYFAMAAVGRDDRLEDFLFQGSSAEVAENIASHVSKETARAKEAIQAQLKMLEKL